MTPEAALTKLSYLLGRSDLTQESRIEVHMFINSYSVNYIEIIGSS